VLLTLKEHKCAAIIVGTGIPAINVNLEKKGVTTGVIDTGDQFACLSLPLAVNLDL
jgi:hypothetical protein